MLLGVADGITASKDVHILILTTSDYVSLHGKKTLQVWLHLKQWDFPELPGWVLCNPKGPQKKDLRGAVRMEAEEMEEMEKGHETIYAGSLKKLEKWLGREG